MIRLLPILLDGATSSRWFDYDLIRRAEFSVLNFSFEWFRSVLFPKSRTFRSPKAKQSPARRTQSRRWSLHRRALSQPCNPLPRHRGVAHSAWIAPAWIVL